MIEDVLRMARNQAGRVLKSPTTLKVLSNPRVQRAMLQAINLRSDIRQKVTVQVEDFARNHNLVTREDVAHLRRTIRELEATVATLRNQVTEASERTQEAKPSKASVSKAAPKRAAAKKASGSSRKSSKKSA